MNLYLDRKDFLVDFESSILYLFVSNVKKSQVVDHFANIGEFSDNEENSRSNFNNKRRIDKEFPNEQTG